MGVTAQTSKAAQNNGLPVSLPSTNKGDTITEREFTSKVYDVVDEHPHFPGGNGALLDWLSKNIHYTSGCASIQGRVVVSFFVEPDGSLSDIELVRKVAPELDEEVLRVVKAMPKWIPASQNNKPIRAKFTMPITFRSE
jgi:protein TonB